MHIYRSAHWQSTESKTMRRGLASTASFNLEKWRGVNCNMLSSNSNNILFHEDKGPSDLIPDTLE